MIPGSGSSTVWEPCSSRFADQRGMALRGTYFAKQISPAISSWNVGCGLKPVTSVAAYNTPVAPANLPVLVVGLMRPRTVPIPASERYTLLALSSPFRCDGQIGGEGDSRRVRGRKSAAEERSNTGLSTRGKSVVAGLSGLFFGGAFSRSLLCTELAPLSGIITLETLCLSSAGFHKENRPPLDSTLPRFRVPFPMASRAPFSTPYKPGRS